MSTRRSPLRAFAGRLAVAFGAAVFFMGSAIVAVNYVIDQKLDSVDRVNVTVADAPPQGANYLLIGSDTRAFVDNERGEGGVRRQEGERRPAVGHDDGAARRAGPPEHPCRVVPP